MTEAELLDGLGSMEAEGLDLSALMPALPQRTAPAPPAPMRTGGLSSLGPVLGALPLLLRGGQAGPVAAAAFLQGIQQARQQKQAQAQQGYQNQRVAFQDQRATDIDAQNAAYRQNVLRSQQSRTDATRQDALMREFATALDKAESPEAIDALTSFYGARLPQMSERLGTFAAPFKAPSRVNRKRAEKQIATLEKTYGQDWALKLGNATHVLPGAETDPETGKPRGISTQELLAMAGTNVQGLPQKPKASVRESVREGMVPDGKGGQKLGWVAWNPETGTMEPVESQTAPVPPRAPASGSQTAANGLPPRVMNLVSQKQRAFENLPVVKNTQIISEGAAFANSLNPNTTNPADDQALIYAFAKAMDPNSVVREGEYATVQKYAQSWASSFGFNAARIFENSPFLTPQARQNMKRTIMAKFKAAQGQYNAVRKSYAKEVNRITGAQDGEDYLTDYGAAFPTDTPLGSVSARDKYRAQQGGR